MVRTRPTRALAAACGPLVLILFCLPWTAYGQSGSRARPPALQPDGPQRQRTGELQTFNLDESQPSVAEIRIVGTKKVPPQRVRALLITREGRLFDSTIVEDDVRRLAKSKLFADVKTFRTDTPQGVIVTFQVVERPTISYLTFVGNTKYSNRTLKRKSELEVGEALNAYSVTEAKKKLVDHYRSRGFVKANVTILEGNQPQDQGVVFLINEGQQQRVWSVKFEGNTVASDARLKTQISSKPGWFYVFGGQLKRQQLDQDIVKLTTYYRSLGYFRARVGREVETSDSGKWVTITFFIDEGPRYRIRNVRFEGITKFDRGDLGRRTELKSDDYFHVAKMNKDVKYLRELYGTYGYVFADVKADPVFYEEPGWMDIVYDVKEGDRYRLGEIHIKIAGENPHTKRSVAMRYISLQPGDLLSTTEIDKIKRRLGSSQLFEHNPAAGVTPTVNIKPRDDDDYIRRTATDGASSGAGSGGARPRGSGSRGY